LDAELFLCADEIDWHFNAVWLFGREKTIQFLSDALVFHLAPLYVPYAPITAKCPEEIIPEEVKEDIYDLMEQFYDNHFLSTMSVADVKHSLAAGVFTTHSLHSIFVLSSGSMQYLARKDSVCFLSGSSPLHCNNHGLC
jgi:hypothetical protein